METYFGAIEQVRCRIARERVWADLNALARDSEDLLKAAAHHASDGIRDLQFRLNAALERAKATCTGMQEQALAAANAAARTTDATLRGRPYVSIGVALAVGVGIGVLAVRGRRRGQDSCPRGEVL